MVSRQQVVTGGGGGFPSKFSGTDRRAIGHVLLQLYILVFGFNGSFSGE